MFSASALSAKEVLWTGAGFDNKWGTAANWDGGELPGSNDIVVFRPDGDLAVSKVNADGSNLHSSVAGLRFESGNTTLSGGYIYTASPTSDVFVAENAKASVANTTDCSDAKYWLKKTGPGSYTATGRVGADRGYPGVIVEEGELILTSNARGSVISRIRVCNDATLTFGTYSMLASKHPDVEIEEGGTILCASSSGDCFLKSLSGRGTIKTHPNNSGYTELKLDPAEDCVFSGRIGLNVRPIISPTASGRFVLGDANVLSETFQVKGSRNLGFAPGIGTFKIATVHFIPDAGYPLVLEDTDGNPVTVKVAVSTTAAASFETSGSGDYYQSGQAISLNGAVVKSTGILGVTAKTLTLGDGTAANDFDFSTLSGLDAAGGELIVNNAADFVFGGSVMGSSCVTLYKPSILSALNMTGGQVKVYDNLAVTGGDAALSTGGAGFVFAAENKTIALTNVSAHGEVAVDPYQGVAHLPTPWGTLLGGDKAGSKITIGPGADLYLRYTSGATGVQTLEQDGGSIHFCGPYMPLSTSTAVNPSEVILNGGTAWMVACKNYFQSQVAPFADSDTLAVRIGEAGVTFRTEGTLGRVDGAGVRIDRPLLSGVSGGTDGGIRQFGYAEYSYTRPMGILGPYFAEGGASIVAGNLAEQPFWFGTGAVTLRNQQLRVSAQFAAAQLKLGDLSVEGGAYLWLRGAAANSQVDAEVGQISVADGSALFLGDAAGLVGTSGGAKVKTTGSVSMAENGRVLAPVFGTQAPTSQHFLGYDADKGFVPLEGIVVADHFSNTDPSKVVTLTQNSYGMDWVNAGDTVAAEAFRMEPHVTLRLYENATLRLGCGGHPTAILMDRANLQGLAGSCVDFGTSDAMIVTAGAAFPSVASSVAVTLKGEKGVSYVAKPYLEYSCWHAVSVSGTNEYAGVTRIGAVCVYASSDRCFSTGDVYVSGGERFGGQVRFNREGGVWNNNFHIAGRGVKETQSTGNRNCGAMSFNKNGTVAGNVELVDFAQLCATGGFRGTISGTVSGDRLRTLGRDGVIALTGSNTYTGGTEVVEAILELGRGDSAGTGEVVLNGGTLRFINDQPITFTNAISGVGKIEIAGTAPVTFTGAEFAGLPLKTLAPGTVFDFPTLANASYVAAVTADGLDLGGKDLTVAGLYGAGTVKGGTLTVTGAINPGGEGAIGTITFETMPVLAGATLFAEVSKTGIDGIELPGDFDLSALNLTVVDLGSRGAHLKEAVVSCSGVRTGAFASVVLPEKRPDRYELSYTDAAAILSVGKGLLMIVR